MAFYMRRFGHPAASLIPVVTRPHDLAPEVVTYRVLDLPHETWRSEELV